MSRVLVFLFRKKPNQIKTLRQIKHPEKNKPKKTPRKNSVLDCSYFLPSLSRKLIFLLFFPVQSQQLEALPKPPEAAPASPAARLLLGLLMCCAAGPIPLLGSRRPFRRRGNLLQSHYIVCYHLVLTSPIPADQQPQNTINNRCS